MGGLVQGIELQPAPGMPGGPLQITLRDAGRDQPLQPAGQRLPQPFGHRRLPLLEVRAAAQDETRQEVIPVQLNRPLQGLGVRPSDQRLELAHVHLDRAELEGHRGPADGQASAHGGRGDRQGAPQRGPALGAVGLRPQQVSELLAAVLAAGHGEQRQQRDGLSGVESDRETVAQHDRRPEQRQPQLRHQPPPTGSP